MTMYRVSFGHCTSAKPQTGSHPCDAGAAREVVMLSSAGITRTAWSEEKQAYLGAIAKVAAVYDDKTMSLKFNDAVELDFPFEVIDLGVTKQLGAAITVVKDFQLIYCGPSGRVVI